MITFQRLAEIVVPPEGALQSSNFNAVSCKHAGCSPIEKKREKA